MSPLAIAWRNLTTRPVQTALTALIVALGAGLAVAVIALAGGTRRGLVEAGGPFELVVGPKGSATQLVNSSVLLQDLPIGNISYAQYEALVADPHVLTAVPIGLGDNVDGLRLVGTTPEFFAVSRAPGQPFYHLARGEPFADEFTAVLGSAAAARLGLDIGATFVSSHGVLPTFEEHAHDATPYTVVGILAPSDTPADLGIYVPLESVWEVHGLHAHDEAHAEDDPIAHACEHFEDSPEELAAGAAIPDDHTHYVVTLMGGAGAVTLTRDEDAEVNFFLGADVPMMITAGGASLAPEASEAVTAGCDAIAIVHTFDLAPGDYTVSFGPNAGNSVALVWEVHGVHAHTEEAGAEEAHAEEEDPGVTAVLIRAKDVSSAYQLYQALNAGTEVQAALPGAVLTQYLDLLGQGQQVLSLVSSVSLIMAGMSVALTLYGVVLAREREIAVLRALGASRQIVLGTALIESLLLGTIGLVGGLVLGYGAAAAVAAAVRQQSAVAVTLAPEPVLGYVALILLGIGLLAGLAPALRAYRIDPAVTLT